MSDRTSKPCPECGCRLAPCPSCRDNGCRECHRRLTAQAQGFE